MKGKLSRRSFIKNGTLVGASLAVGGSFLRPATGRAAVIRPPGALSEDDFLSRCIRCGQCADACPNQCISAFSETSGKRFSASPGSGEAGTPVIFPRQQACNLCNGAHTDELLCTTACPTGALQRLSRKPDEIQEKVQMGYAKVDKNLCYSYTGSSCGVCVRACPFEGKALKAGFMEQPVLNLEYCVGCGLCERACIRYPQAITVIPTRERSV